MGNKTFNLLIFASVSAAIMVGFYAYSVHYVQGLVDDTASLRSDIEQDQAQYQHLQVLHDAIASTGDDKQKITHYFVPAGGAVDFITSFEKAAVSSSLKFTTVSIDTSSIPELDSQGKELLDVVFSTEGSWSNTLHFLSLLESLPYSVSIDRVEVSSSGEAPSLVGSGSDIQKGQPGKTVQPGPSDWKTSLSFRIVKIKDDAR